MSEWDDMIEIIHLGDRTYTKKDGMPDSKLLERYPWSMGLPSYGGIKKYHYDLYYFSNENELLGWLKVSGLTEHYALFHNAITLRNKLHTMINNHCLDDVELMRWFCGVQTLSEDRKYLKEETSMCHWIFDTVPQNPAPPAPPSPNNSLHINDRASIPDFTQLIIPGNGSWYGKIRALQTCPGKKGAILYMGAGFTGDSRFYPGGPTNIIYPINDQFQRAMSDQDLG